MGQAQDLVLKIQEEFRSGKLELPSLPEVVVKINKYVGDPDVNLASIAKVIQLDPALSARLIQIANSPLYRRQTSVEDCRTAIARLGLATTRNLVTSFTLQRHFDMKTPVIRDIARTNWQHSSEVAAIAYVLAKLTKGMQPDKALLAGLVHNIGCLPVLRYATEYKELQNNRKLLKEIIDRLGAKLGKAILKHWSFDADMIDIPIELNNNEYRPDENPNYVDIVIVAYLHSQFGKNQQEQATALHEVASFRKLPMFQIGPDASIELLYEARDEISTMMKMLMAA